MPVRSKQPPPEEFHQALSKFVSSFQPFGRPMPVSAAVDSIRETIGPSELTDCEIKEMVTDYAILRGLNVHMDGNSKNEIVEVGSVPATRAS
jgi:hypothetical protein